MNEEMSAELARQLEKQQAEAAEIIRRENLLKGYTAHVLDKDEDAELLRKQLAEGKAFDEAEERKAKETLVSPVVKVSKLSDEDLRPDPFTMNAEDVVANTLDPLSNVASKKRVLERRKLEMGK